MYIDAANVSGRIWVSERDKGGTRSIKTFMPPYVFYYQDDFGSFRSMFNDKLKRVRFNTWKEWKNSLDQKLAAGVKVFESDVKVAFRFLEEHYTTTDTPPLHVSILDIEVDKDSNKNWARPDDPYGQITSVSLHNKWEDQLYVLAVPPPNLSYAAARALLDGEVDQNGSIDDFGPLTEEKNYFLCHDEKELLSTLIGLIEDADVISGWNSEFFDLPYLISRIRVVLGGEDYTKFVHEDGSKANPVKPSTDSASWLAKLCLFPQLPKMRFKEQFKDSGEMLKVWELVGRVHLDYMMLYKKFNLERLHQYNLDFILKKDIQQSKLTHDMPLYELYRKDFRRHTAYNRQDTAGLSALDDKKKLIELANQMAHLTGVTLDKTLGSVAIIETALLRKLHQKKLIAPDKKKQIGEKAPGAFVVDPIAGIYKKVVSIDLKSLYPSAMRLCNISPECLIGQFDLTRTKEEFQKWLEVDGEASTAWRHFTGALEYHMVVDGTDDILTLCFEDGGEISAPAHEWKQILLEKNWAISGNATVFNMDKEGVITECLTEWYNDRISMKNLSIKYGIAQADETDPAKLIELKELETYYDMIQQAKKIFLNSTYGACLNKAFRFYDERLGRSVTLTGRVITKHMIRQTSKILTGNYDFDRRVIIYGDTDSCYMTLEWFLQEKKWLPISNARLVKVANGIATRVNASFPTFVSENFLVSRERSKVIQAARDVVALRGFFKDKKKKYCLHVINAEGKTVDKLKVVGIESRRSDTPKYMQVFLEKCLEMIVKQALEYDDLKAVVRKFREETFRQMEPWRRGSPCRVNKLHTTGIKVAAYDEAVAEGYVGMAKPHVHWSVSASLNTNRLMNLNAEHRWDFIRDGDNIEILYLLPNLHDMTSVAMKVGDNYVPEWFKELPIDNARHEKKMIDQKLANIFGVLGWEFAAPTNYADEICEEEDFFAPVLNSPAARIDLSWLKLDVNPEIEYTTGEEVDVD